MDACMHLWTDLEVDERMGGCADGEVSRGIDESVVIYIQHVCRVRCGRSIETTQYAINRGPYMFHFSFLNVSNLSSLF
jgi:hypothetical protein